MPITITLLFTPNKAGIMQLMCEDLESTLVFGTGNSVSTFSQTLIQLRHNLWCQLKLKNKAVFVPLKGNSEANTGLRIYSRGVECSDAS